MLVIKYLIGNNIYLQKGLNFKINIFVILILIKSFIFIIFIFNTLIFLGLRPLPENVWKPHTEFKDNFVSDSYEISRNWYFYSSIKLILIKPFNDQFDSIISRVEYDFTGIILSSSPRTFSRII